MTTVPDGNSASNGIPSSVWHMPAADTGIDTGTPNRRERRLRETRRAILDSARRLFDSDGYAQTTVEQIAEAADVAPRTFFRYFPTKESLLFATLDELRQGMFDALEQRPEDEPPLQSLSIVLADLAREVEAHREELSWGFRMADELGVDGAYERSLVKQHTHARIAELIAARLGVDPETDPRPLAFTMAAMGVFGSAMRARATGTACSPEESVRRFDELLAATGAALSEMAAVRGDARAD